MPLTGPGIQSIDDKSELAQFANGVASQTGIDPRVVYAWAQQETGGHAYGHNWLNLRPYHQNQGGSTDDVGVVAVQNNFDRFGSVQEAITSTVHRLNQPFASGIVAAREQTPAQEIAAIAQSGWDAGHYGGAAAGGPNLRNTFSSIYGAPALGSAAQKGAKVSGSTGSAGTGLGVGSIPVVGGAISGIGDAFTFLTSWRFAEVLGGFVLVLLGLYLLGRQFGVGPPSGVASAAAMV